MRGLEATELLGVWERGLAQPPTQRAITMLASAFPEVEPGALARLSVGQRDARLLTLRESTFGPRLAGTVSCPECAQRLEMVFNIDDIRVADPAHESAENLTLSVAGHDLEFRLPNSVDLAAIAGEPDESVARRALLGRCLVSARKGDAQMAIGDLSEPALAAVVERMAQADPQANLELDLSCPACHWRWKALFDIAAFYWTELNAWAQRLMHEVHVLATAYGWREADIVAMHPTRRRFYLEMAGE